MNKYDAFISFAFENQEIVNEVVNELTNKYGVSCWLCLDKVSAGQSYKEEIPGAIDNSSMMVLFVSKDSISSDDVPKEVDMALEAKKIVIPFRLDDAKYEGSLRYDLLRVNYIDATIPTFEERVDDLAREICRVANKPFCVKESTLTQKSSDKFNGRKADNSNFHSSAVRETDAKNGKKEKIVIWSLLILFVSLIGLGIGSKIVDIPHTVEQDVNVYQMDTVPPSITLSEPRFNTDSLKSGSIEFTVFVEEDSEFVSVNINDDMVETIGFTGDMEVVDEGKTQVLRFTNIEKTADECYITLLEGVAKDATNNKSEICNSQKFNYNTVSPIMSIGPKEKDKIVKEGDTAVYFVAVSDDEFLLATSLQKSDIRMYGFVADITINKKADANHNVWEITFTNIKFNSSSEAKYFEIAEGIAVDAYGNINSSLQLPLKTK